MTPLISTALLRTQSDERLVRLAAAGHDRAFEAIVERYRKPLLRHARRLLGDGPRAEDVVQAALVSAWAALRDGVEVRDLRPWLYRIVHNGSLNALKRAGEDHAELPATLAAGAGPEIDFERRDAMRRTLDAVAALPARQRAALLAIAVDGRPHGEVAAELGMTSGALRQLVHRARTSLRAVATAFTPGPAAAWAARAAHDATAARIAEVAAGAGGAGVAGAAIKAGALAITAGAIVAGAPQDVARLVSPHDAHHALRAAAHRTTAPRPAAPPTADHPAGDDRPGARDGHGRGAVRGRRHDDASEGGRRGHHGDSPRRSDDRLGSSGQDTEQSHDGSPAGTDDHGGGTTTTSGDGGGTSGGSGSSGGGGSDGGTTTTVTSGTSGGDGGGTSGGGSGDTLTTSTVPSPTAIDGSGRDGGGGDGMSSPTTTTSSGDGGSNSGPSAP